MTSDSDPARFLKYFRPPVPIDRRTERIFLLVGAAALYVFESGMLNPAPTQVGQAYPRGM